MRGKTCEVYRVAMVLPVLMVVAIMLAGCGGTPTGDSAPAALEKLSEEAGPGIVAEKESPIDLAGGETRLLETAIPVGAPTTSVPTLLAYTGVKRIYWASFTAPGGQRRVVLLQPEVGTQEDSDLYVLNYAGSPGLNVLGYSRRSVGNASREALADWTDVLTTGPTTTAQRFNIAVYGYSSPADTTPDFRLEADVPGLLAVNGGWAPGLEATPGSDWFRFMAVSGTHYTVYLNAISGDPDIYLYEDTSYEYLGKNIAVGGGTLGFTAAETSYHHIRVYAFSNTQYYIRVTSP